MKKERIMILILVVITIVVIGVFIFARNNNGEKGATQGNTQTEQNEVKEEFVQETADGTKVNISNKLKETKKLDGLEISEIQLSEQNNISKLMGTITNTSTTAKGGYAIRINVLDKNGNEVIEVGGYIKQLQPGESTKLNCSATFDYANAYDIKIEKKS